MTQEEIIFNDMREQEHYHSLGDWFWHQFLFTRGKKRKLINKLWDSLTKEEQEKCE